MKTFYNVRVRSRAKTGNRTGSAIESKPVSKPANKPVSGPVHKAANSPVPKAQKKRAPAFASLCQNDWEPLVETLLLRDAHVVDWLPAQVPSDAGAHFFEVEAALLAGHAPQLAAQHLRVLLGLLCYDAAVMEVEGHWQAAEAAALTSTVQRLFRTGRGDLRLLFHRQPALLTLSGGDLHMTVYGADGDFATRLAALTTAAGLFLRPAAE